MTCSKPFPEFPTIFYIGIQDIAPTKDGYTVALAWGHAEPSIVGWSIGYNIYFSNTRDNVFTEGAKYFTPNTSIVISRFTPGEIVYFAIRATQYYSSDVNYLNLVASTDTNDGYVIPNTYLSTNISDTELHIPLIDCSEFPTYGVIQVGKELIKYSNVDYLNNIILVEARGYYETDIRIHNVDGYDGYGYNDPIVKIFRGFEDDNTVIARQEIRCEYPEFPFTQADGYKQVIKDILTTDLVASDNYNQDFARYDYSGYNRTSMSELLSGHCIGSYIGGSYGCAGSPYKIRGLDPQTINNQRQEMLLEVIGEPVVLLKRMWTGLRCNCFRMNQEASEGNCHVCFGVGYVGGYEQYYDKRRSDGRILVRFDASADDLESKQIGLEQNYRPTVWTLVVPAIKDRDLLIRFNQDGTEEFRYEVVNVTRNKTFFSLSGAQKMQVYRLDKTDVKYQWRAIRNTATIPKTINTTLSSLRNYGPHMHTLVINESIVNLSQINSTTSISAGHSHPIINGQVEEILGHTHNILLL